jgi:hypothetical protein
MRDRDGRSQSIVARRALEKIEAYIEARGFAGYDPYDALNSPLLRRLSLGRKDVRIAFTQLLRRLPVNLRPLLGIRPGLNPKALGLFLGGYARLCTLPGGDRYQGTVSTLVDLLEGTRSKGYSGNCWGYNFDWQSRAFYVPAGTPTVVNSAFIGHALLDAYELAGCERARGMALPIRQFILRDLNRTGTDDSFAFSYTPIDSLAVHNASLLGASLLIRLERDEPDAESRAAALGALRWSLERQRPDGTWPYAETSYQAWIDSFHTGFNLESIQRFLEAGEAPEARDAFERGTRFYADRFFLPDGTPKYYHDRIYPIDIHSPAEAVTFFSSLGERYRILTERVLSWMVRNLQDDLGYFYFRKGRVLTNRIPYVRWGQAWAFRALSSYVFDAERHHEVSVA